MKVVYFASLRRLVGVSEEQVSLPPGVDRVDRLIDWLKSQSPRHRAALDSGGRLMVAVNQDYADGLRLISDSDEVALFPPVTGG